MRESLSKKYQHQINTLIDYASIFSGPDRASVDLTCAKYEIKVIGKEILDQSGRDALNLVYSMLNDKTGEIKDIWKKI